MKLCKCKKPILIYKAYCRKCKGFTAKYFAQGIRLKKLKGGYFLPPGIASEIEKLVYNSSIMAK